MQFKFYIVFGLFSKLIRKFYISCSLSRENHCVSQNNMDTKMEGLNLSQHKFYFHDHTGVIWRYLII